MTVRELIKQLVGLPQDQEAGPASDTAYDHIKMFLELPKSHQEYVMGHARRSAMSREDWANDKERLD